MTELAERSRIIADYFENKFGGLQFDYAGQGRFTLASHLEEMNETIDNLAEALRETLEIASRNEAGAYIRRALDALSKATAPSLPAE